MPEPWRTWEKPGRMGNTNRRKSGINSTLYGDFLICLSIIVLFCFDSFFFLLLCVPAIDTLARVAYRDWLDPLFIFSPLSFSAVVS
jgi:hypothetical protein